VGTVGGSDTIDGGAGTNEVSTGASVGVAVDRTGRRVP
jgi:hypothetical protein